MCECLTNNFERRCHGKWKLVAARSSCTYVSSGIWQLHITQLQVTLTDHLYPATRSYIITCNIVEFIRISLQFSTLKIYIYQQLSFTAILKSFTLDVLELFTNVIIITGYIFVRDTNPYTVTVNW